MGIFQCVIHVDCAVSADTMKRARKLPLIRPKPPLCRRFAAYGHELRYSYGFTGLIAIRCDAPRGHHTPNLWIRTDRPTTALHSQG